MPNEDIGGIKYTTSNLVEFEAVVDTDLAIIDYMTSNYKTSFFKESVLNASSRNVIKNLLLFRDDSNPLTVLLKDEYLDSAEDLFKEITETKYEEVLKIAEPTDIFRYIKTLEDETEGVVVSTINCKNKLQQQMINELAGIMRTDINQKDMSVFTCLFIKNIKDIETYRNFGGKYIYLSNFRFNLNEDFVIKLDIASVAGYNSVKLIDPYVGLILPKGEI